MAARRWEGGRAQGHGGYGNNVSGSATTHWSGRQEEHRVPQVCPWYDENKNHGARAQSNAGSPNRACRRRGVSGLTKTGVRAERRTGARGCNPWGVQASSAHRWGDAVNGSRYPCTRRHVERRVRRMQSPSWLSASRPRRLPRRGRRLARAGCRTTHPL